MGKAKELSSEKKILIIRAVERKIPYKQICELYDVAKPTISALVKRFKERNTVDNKSRSGRPKKTSQFVDKMLVKECRNDPRKTAVDLNAYIRKMYGVNCSVDTVKRRLRQYKLFGRRPAKKPLISVKNRKARIKFAQEHLNWTAKEWSKVLFTDESKFCLFGSDGIKYVRRPKGTRFDPKYQLPTVKHGGGNVMVWGGFSRDSVGPIHRIEGIMDQKVYLEIMKNIMLPHGKDKMPRGWVLQQDNDPKHCAKTVKDFFKSKKIRVLEWPSQSPDLNPIEHLWEHVDRQLKGQKPANKNELFEKIAECWANIPIDVLISLVDSMPRRCQAVLNAKGYATKY